MKMSIYNITQKDCHLSSAAKFIFHPSDIRKCAVVNFLSCSCTSGLSYIYGAKCQHNTVYQSNLLCYLTSNKTKFTDQKRENFIGFTAVWSNVLVFFYINYFWLTVFNLKGSLKVECLWKAEEGRLLCHFNE